MLLRASRQAAYLTKQAGLVSGVGSLAAKGVGGALGSIGKTMAKHPVGTLAVATGGTVATMQAAEDIKRARIGMSPAWSEMRRRGMTNAAMPGRDPNKTYTHGAAIRRLVG